MKLKEIRGLSLTEFQNRAEREAHDMGFVWTLELWN